MVLQWPPFLYSIFNKKGEAVKKKGPIVEKRRISKKLGPLGMDAVCRALSKGQRQDLHLLLIILEHHHLSTSSNKAAFSSKISKKQDT